MSDDLPADHDVIVVGTGMPESIVAAAVARIGQRVLHLDKEAHYGGLWASYNFENLREWVFERQNPVQQEENLNTADTEALLKPGETFVQVPHHYASVTNAKEIINVPPVLPETQEEESEPHAVQDPTEFSLDTTGEHPFLVPPASMNSQADSASSSIGDLLPTSSSSETGIFPDAVPQEHRLPDTSGTATTATNAAHSGNDEPAAQNAHPTNTEMQIFCPTTSAAAGENNTSSQMSDSQTESQNVAGVCPCPNFIGGEVSETQTSSTDEALAEAATIEASSTSEASSIDAIRGSVPRPEDVTDNSQETSVGAAETGSVPSRTSTTAQKQEVPKEWSFDQFMQLARKFNLDLAPKLLFSRGPMVELLISSNIARYAEFKALTRILTHHEGTLHQVPCSRADVFGCKEVQLVEKRMLMKFLKFCLEYHNHPDEYRGYEGRPFKEFLRSKKLTPTVEHYIFHAIAMCEEDIPTLQGLKASQKFLESLGRYGNSPFLSSLFGSGELPQCFCRLCAVFGGIYHLQRGPGGIIRNAAGHCVAMVSNGRRFNFKWLVMESSYAPSAFKAFEGLQRVSRAIVITNKSLYPAEKEQITLLRLPKGSAPSAVIVHELGPGMMVCPNGLFVIHMTCPSVSNTAEEDLTPAVELLFESASCKHEQQVKPKALYTLFFNCEDTTSLQINQNAPPGLIMVSTPGPHLDYEHAVREAREIFHTMYPDEEFLPRAPDPEEILIEYENNPGEHEPPIEGESEKDQEKEPVDRGDCAKSSSSEDSGASNNPSGDFS